MGGLFVRGWPREAIIDSGDRNGAMSLLVQFRSSNGEILPQENVRDEQKFTEYLQEDSSPHKVLVMTTNTRTIHIDYESTVSDSEGQTPQHHYFTSVHFLLYSQTSGGVKSRLSEVKFSGWTISGSEKQMVQAFQVVVPDSTSTYKLEVRAKNIASRKLEVSFYSVTGSIHRWIAEESDYIIKNMETEVYNPRKSYTHQPTKIEMLSSDFKIRNCSSPSMVYVYFKPVWR
ncbi:hypothetical protein RF11_14732 [Thelohanellus kitauei]|uniref:Uncharacterized protein n=1 Tax=Thelohanellus kitauei TaxID=669202 RepID=A0A0C2MGJ0_THEKT|nr:hypothetical protein RF11_14732 [Thelohanellus kitauei]